MLPVLAGAPHTGPTAVWCHPCTPTSPGPHLSASGMATMRFDTSWMPSASSSGTFPNVHSQRMSGSGPEEDSGDDAETLAALLSRGPRDGALASLNVRCVCSCVVKLFGVLARCLVLLKRKAAVTRIRPNRSDGFGLGSEYLTLRRAAMTHLYELRGQRGW